jgi:excisionase family DNA binding protein
MSDPASPWWKYKQAANWLGVPTATVRSLVFQRKIPHHRISKRVVLFDPAELQSWWASTRVAAK